MKAAPHWEHFTQVLKVKVCTFCLLTETVLCRGDTLQSGCLFNPGWTALAVKPEGWCHQPGCKWLHWTKCNYQHIKRELKVVFWVKLKLFCSREVKCLQDIKRGPFTKKTFIFILFFSSAQFSHSLISNEKNLTSLVTQALLGIIAGNRKQNACLLVH